MNLEKLKLRLQQPLPGKLAQDRMISRLITLPTEVPDSAKVSAVLIVFLNKNDTWHIVYIQRAIDGHAHSGQIGFPGGKQEKFDSNLRATALREAQEEIGIVSNAVEIIGQLSSLYIPVSNFNVYPFVAVASSTFNYRLQASEVARVLEVPVSTLINEEIKTTFKLTAADHRFIRSVPAYQLEADAILWGATAMITAELEQILLDCF
ncbi:MAG TPA: CoA pyrophosphatase [Flavipsychrobacter sp.]|nr:CoA pyrophosphatase [Flavipsychrobacter sp.]